MMFKNNSHRENYEKFLERDNTRETDAERKSLFYLLACNSDIANNIKDLYDFNKKWIQFEGLEQAWQTSSSLAICYLAFNLYNGYRADNDGKKACRNTPVDVFYIDEFRPYMIEALRIRFENIE